MTPLPPRGIRNNNPGNIDRTDPRAGWLGALPSGGNDGRFEQFIDPVYGLRAIGKVLRHYQEADNCDTLRAIINRWAPRSENNTGAYIASVIQHAASVGAAIGDADQDIDVHAPGVMHALMKAIVTHENGVDPYAEALYKRAIELALT